MGESEQAHSGLVLRACTSSIRGPIVGYRLAIEAKNIDTVVLSSIRFDNVGGPIVISEVTHNRAARVLASKCDAVLAQIFAVNYLDKIADEYSRALNIPYHKILR